MNKNTIFAIKKLYFWYPNSVQPILQNINMEILRHEVTAFIGSAGSGKTTLLQNFNKMTNVIGDVKITGSILFDQKSELITPPSPKKIKNIFGLLTKKNQQYISAVELRSRVGMIFSKPTLFPMSIYENVAYGPKSFGMKKSQEITKIVQQALKDVALWTTVKNNLHSSPTGLSIIDQQKLCIARAIAVKPQVLLMDEPTLLLDPVATYKIENLVKKLKNKYTIIVTTHSVQQASRIANKTAFFHKGKLVEFGDTKKILATPQKVLTKNYISTFVGHK